MNQSGSEHFEEVLGRKIGKIAEGLRALENARENRHFYYFSASGLDGFTQDKNKKAAPHLSGRQFPFIYFCYYDHQAFMQDRLLYPTAEDGS